ncbi:hypothetical protein KY290_030970 [Solanum tuberosum]|uniref:Retrotransposon gag domain-containing protein n=1 Tax=Solanum tuberosum TaxID=4113 RepID=A0ABQ7U7U4_SOLTU|nr:hypothetical protein KY290_030970 [Solanum tuberosum]
MEDQKVLKAFVDDSILELKNSISKDLAEFCSMLLEVLKEKDRTSSEPLNTIMDAKLWQFRGENPEAWIVQAEYYFDFYKIEKDQKLMVVSPYLDGEAFQWYQWLFRNNQLTNWPHLADKVRIRFKEKGYESAAERFHNLRQVTYVIENQNRCEDILSSFECKCNTNACKMFDELSDRYEDSNPLDTFNKHIELSIAPNDLLNSFSRLVVVNGCNEEAKNEDNNDKEDIVTIIDEPIEFVIANVDKPSLYINSIISIPCDLAIKAYPLELVQRWEEMSSILSTCSYAKLINRGGQTLFIESSVGYSCNASKGLYIAGEVHLLVLYANFDAKPEGIVHEPPSVNDDQQFSHKSLFPRHIGDVHFYYVAEYAKRTDSVFFLLASTELVFMKIFLIGKDFHVLPVKRRDSYNADGLLVSAPYADVHEDAKHDLKNDSKLPWTYHTLCHVYQREFCYKEAILSEANYSLPWSPLSFFNCTHNEGRIALCYTKKTRMKLTCSITGVFLLSYLVEQMVIPWIGFGNATSFSLSIRFNKDPIRANVEMLAIPSSSTLLGICYMPPEVGVQNLQVPLPSMLYHMAENLHKTNVFVLNFFEKFSYESVTFPSSIWLYLNLEDKVLISGESIVVNTADQVIGLDTKPQRGPRIRQPNTCFAWDPG